MDSYIILKLFTISINLYALNFIFSTTFSNKTLNLYLNIYILLFNLKTTLNILTV